MADIAPGPAPEVLARLLNGSKFNFLILSAVDDPAKLDRVILSTRPEGAYVAPPPLAPVQNPDPQEQEPASMNLQPQNPAPAPPVPTGPDGKPADDTTPDQ